MRKKLNTETCQFWVGWSWLDFKYTCPLVLAPSCPSKEPLLRLGRSPVELSLEQEVLVERAELAASAIRLGLVTFKVTAKDGAVRQNTRETTKRAGEYWRHSTRAVLKYFIRVRKKSSSAFC